MAVDFWLLEAPDSLAKQSEINADGFGIASLTTDKELMLIKKPVEAATDATFRRAAKHLEAAEMIVHLRFASNGGKEIANTHPFVQDGRIFAHNGIMGDTDRIDTELGEDRAMITGDSDSERLFAVITMAIRDADGDVRAGIRNAVNRLADDYELYAINFVMAEQGEIWALRYPEKNDLFVLEREAGGEGGDRELEGKSSDGNLRLRTGEATDLPLVIVASEKICEEPGWSEVKSGELIHIGPDLKVDREMIIEHPPQHQMVLKGHAEKTQTH